MKTSSMVWIPSLLLFACCSAITILPNGNATAASLEVNTFTLPLLVQIPAAVDSAREEETCEAELDLFTTRQYRTIELHKKLAYATAGILLAADGVGLYHFLQLQRRGHEIRDRLGYTEESVDVGPETEGVRQVWAEKRSQSERVIHTGLIVLGSLSYASTAAIKLSMPRMSKSQSPVSDTRLHRYAFYLHAGLMAANIALGFVESSSLNRGNHALVTGAGIAHIVVGFSVPVVMLGAGAMFKLPNEY